MRIRFSSEQAAITTKTTLGKVLCWTPNYGQYNDTAQPATRKGRGNVRPTKSSPNYAPLAFQPRDGSRRSGLIVIVESVLRLCIDRLPRPYRRRVSVARASSGRRGGVGFSSRTCLACFSSRTGKIVFGRHQIKIPCAKALVVSCVTVA